jgi:acetyl-CoA carboxylase carboxyl transferase subunit alpha
MRYYLDFEKPIEEIESKIEELRRLSDGKDIDLTAEIRKLDKKVKELRTEIFSNLTPWQKTMIARHPDRPYSLDYIAILAKDFVELHGDRRFADDPSVVGGLGKIRETTFMIIGHQKGRGTRERIFRNFGQPHPEGYRKALRLMKLAERFGVPIITFIDTPGAYPGIGAEERGQAEAVAMNLMEMSRIKTPIISIVIGEGGSGGALAIGVADRIYMFEHAIYSVISPEGCAAILWRRNGEIGTEEYEKAARTLKLTAQDLLRFKVIDEVIPEPPGGAHRDYDAAAAGISAATMKVIDELKELPQARLIEKRHKRFRNIGVFE